jgi:hypothetical protein
MIYGAAEESNRGGIMQVRHFVATRTQDASRAVESNVLDRATSAAELDALLARFRQHALDVSAQVSFVLLDDMLQLVAILTRGATPQHSEAPFPASELELRADLADALRHIGDLPALNRAPLARKLDLRRFMAPSDNRRFATAHALARALRETVTALPVSSKQTIPFERVFEHVYVRAEQTQAAALALNVSTKTIERTRKQMIEAMLAHWRRTGLVEVSEHLSHVSVQVSVSTDINDA